MLIWISDTASFACCIAYCIVAISFMVIRKKEPNLARPYKVNNYTISGDTKGRQTLDNIGSGEGWYISNGYAVPITWEKSSRSSKTIYKYLDGTEIKVNDGNTFIQIQPSGMNLTIE